MKKKEPLKGTVICDGRGNAGTGARAAVLTLEDGRVFEKAEQIEPTTNIVAEHLSIQLGLELAKKHKVDDLLIFNDSQVPVFHITGKYKVNEAHLRPIVRQTWEMATDFHRVEIRWTPRENTKRADKLCREIDRKSNARRSRPGGSVPQAPQRENPFLKLKARRKT